MPLERVIELSEFRTGLRVFLRESERVAERWGLTPQRYLLLLSIKGAPDGSERISFGRLADRLQLSRNSVTELVARAEEAKLVRREPSDRDQRVTYLRLTEEGERRLLGALGEGEANRRELVRAFDSLAADFRQGTAR
jgi:DNA-binding MarR family transcriptional regulator